MPLHRCCSKVYSWLCIQIYAEIVADRNSKTINKGTRCVWWVINNYDANSIFFIYKNCAMLTLLCARIWQNNWCYQLLNGSIDKEIICSGEPESLRWNSWTSLTKTRVFCSMLFTVPSTGVFSRKPYSSLVLKSLQKIPETRKHKSIHE